MSKFKKAYLLYTNEAYLDLAKMCIDSIKDNSDIPILLYGINFLPEIDGVSCFHWFCDVEKIEKRGDYIDRNDSNIYKLLIQRPAIVLNALKHCADEVAYVDTDSIASKHVDNIFNHFDSNSTYPYFTEGIYDYLHVNGRGGADSKDDLSGTLEAPACEIFSVNQYVRERYIQTGYFVAGQQCRFWLNEWYWMCINPYIMRNNSWYAPFHEETIANVLLWKHNQFNRLPYCYVNGLVKDIKFTGDSYHLRDWVRIPSKKEELFFYHGEKNINKIQEFINQY